jgi:hypothetical protein
MLVPLDNSKNGMPPRRRKIGLSLIAVLCGIAIPLLVLEITLRFLPVSSSTGTMVVDDGNPLIRYVPNQSFTFSKGWDFTIVNSGRVNNYGFVNDQDYTRYGDKPLIVIGDSFVEAMMVPYQQTLQGRLARLLERKGKVYSIGMSGAQLAEYLAFAEYAWTEFQPRGMVFVVVGNDFDESLIKYRNDPGYYYFDEATGSHDLRLTRTDYHPSLSKRLVRNSALARYLWLTVGIGQIPRLEPQKSKADVQYVGNTAAYASEARLADSRRVVDRFFSELPQRVDVNKCRLLFVVDAMRPQIYSELELSRAAGSYFALMRQYFMEAAERNGHEVIDMQPRFISHYHRDGTRFEFATDGHWNGMGHQEAAEAVASSRVVKALVTLSSSSQPSAESNPQFAARPPSEILSGEKPSRHN